MHMDSASDDADGLLATPPAPLTSVIDEIGDPRSWYGTNLVGVSSHWLASCGFNTAPRALHIAGTRASHRGLFSLLDAAPDGQAAADVFEHYMALSFGIGKRQAELWGTPKRVWRSSYVKVLQGWGFDANSPPGAVLKGWVESRFGITPTFHDGPLERFPSAAWLRYLQQKLGSRYHSNCIQLQLDLLYEYCQWSLARFAGDGPARRTLYRGIDRSQAHFLRGGLSERRGVLRLNNLVSFSSSRAQAGVFGELIIEAEVPHAKLLYYPGLVRDKVLTGEGEWLVIGGDYDVAVAYH